MLKRRFAIALLSSTLVAAAGAQTDPDEFLVSSYTQSTQQKPQVAMDPDGNVVVVWQSTGSPGDDASGDSVQARFFAPDGTAGEQQQVNTHTDTSQLGPDVAVDDAGNVFVVWYGNVAAGYTNIFGQRYDASGTALGSEITSMNRTAHDYNPDVGINAAGDVVVAWWEDGTYDYIRFLRFTPSGSASGSIATVTTSVNPGFTYPAVAVATDGAFVIAYAQNNADPIVYARMYNSAGTALGAAFPVSSTSAGAITKPRVEYEPDGNFVVFWRHKEASGDYRLKGRRYAPSGAGVGTEFDLITPIATDFDFDVAFADDGELVAVWDDAGNIQARRYAPVSFNVVAQLKVNPDGTNAEDQPAVAARGGRIYVAWRSDRAGNLDIMGRHLAGDADLSIIQDAAVTSSGGQETVTYTITATNNGPDAASASVTDTFPTGLTCTWTSTATGGATGNTASGSGNLAETLTLPATSTVTWTVPCPMDTGLTGTVSNTAEISSSTDDPDATNNSATVTHAVENLNADLSITVDDGLTTAVPGESTITYTIVASNQGPDTASATVRDTFPAALTCSYSSVAAGGASGNTAGAGNLSDNVTLPASSSVTYTATCNIHPTSTGTLSNTATISSAVTDSVLSNNSSTDGNTVLEVLVDLTVGLSGPDEVGAEGTLVYTVIASNQSAREVKGVTLKDVFPPVMNCNFTSTAQGGATGNSASGRGDLGQSLILPSGAAVEYTVTCEVDDDAEGTLTNTATIRSRIQDSNPANNTATVATAVVPATDLTVSVSDDPDPVKVGGEVTYTVTVTNNGYADAAGVVVQSYLQGAVTLAATSGCAEDSPTRTLTLPLVCTLGTVAEGDSKSFTVRVNITAAGALGHRAEVASSTLESDPGDEEANESTTVN